MFHEKALRRLVIKVFRIDDVVASDKFAIEGGRLFIGTQYLAKLAEKEKYVSEMRISIVKPGERDRYVNSVMDIFPISTKALGGLGEGITHTMTGVCCVLTGIYADGTQVAGFGSSEGNLKEQIYFGRAGTPAENDILILFDAVLKTGSDGEPARSIPTTAHKISDAFVQKIREPLKRLNGASCSERHEYYDKIRLSAKKIAIIKQVAGQGAMYDTRVFPHEPSGAAGGRSVIDIGNVPVIMSPNEYRDGAIRAMC